MTPEKVAVLVITGVIAVLLSITLMGSPDAGDQGAAATPPASPPAPQGARTPAPPREAPPREPRPIDIEIATGGGYRTQLKPAPKTEPLTGGGAAPNPPGTVGGGTYKILQGDTLAKVAKKTYGRSSASDAILAANPGLDPRKLRAGTEIRMPALKPSGAVKAPAAVPSPTVAGNNGTRLVSATPEPPANAKKSPPANPKSWHLVAKGENLETIAKNRYGKSSDWTKIHAANRDLLPNPSSLRAGMKLRIP